MRNHGEKYARGTQYISLAWQVEEYVSCPGRLKYISYKLSIETTHALYT